MGEQQPIGSVDFYSDEDKRLGLDLAWDVTGTLAEKIREWVRVLNLKRPRLLQAYRRRDGKVVVLVKQSNRIDGHPTRLIATLVGTEQSDFAFLWASREVRIEKGVPPRLGDRIRVWAVRHWRHPQVTVSRERPGRYRIYQVPYKKRPELDEIIGIDDDLDDLWIRWRALNALR